MQHITSTSGDPANKSPTVKTKIKKSKDNNNNQHSGRSDNKEEHRSETDKRRTYCYRKNHSREDCFKLKKKELERMPQPSQPLTAATVSAVKEEDKYTDDTVVLVSSDNSRTISTNNSVINVISVNGYNSLVLALLDTGNRIFFMCSKTFCKFFDSNALLNLTEKTYKALNGLLRLLE